MNITVFIKQVPDTQDVKWTDNNNIDRTGMDSVINPVDKEALEAALRIKDETNAKITAVTMGPKKAVEILKEAIAMGVDDAFLLCDSKFAGSDTLATSKVLTAAINLFLQDTNLFIFGQSAQDGETGQTGPCVAARMNIPCITRVNEIIETSDDFIIVNSETEELKGMEALIRWKNEEYGSVPPVQFIPVLEQDTLFPELGKWILRQAMTDGRLLVEKYPNFIMNVNLSYAQLEKSDFVADVLNLLEETGFPPHNLCLEITERCRLLDMSLLQSMFEIFKEKGIKVALDDFGTGFSSLGVLRVLPIDTVKIDREFVKNIERSHSDQYTVQFISDLAKAFEAEVCVEGVETAEMRDFLKSYNVSSFQGYYYSKPIPIEEFYKNMVK